jgi:hopanoid-associated phosphorylase
VTRIGVITGLAAEAEIFDAIPSDRRPRVAPAGASAARAEAAARKLLDQGCGAILGVAGGLDPALAPGTVVVAESVIAPDGRRFPARPAWRDAVLATLLGLAPLAPGAICGADSPLLTRDAKRDCRARTGAVAVDMESHGAARAAAARNAPFLVIRAIADTAARAIPPWVMDAVLPDGGLAPEKVARALLPRPWMVWSLIGLARDNGRAMNSLSRVATRLGPGLGLAL